MLFQKKNKALKIFHTLFLCEIMSGFVLLGIIKSRLSIEVETRKALRELQVAGFNIPTKEDPVTIDFRPTTKLKRNVAGYWEPKKIYLHNNPEGSNGSISYLRHELAHEASFRTCAKTTPNWVLEAIALNFSKELNNYDIKSKYSCLPELKASVKTNNSLNECELEALKQLIIEFGWPKESCEVSAEIQSILFESKEDLKSEFSYIVLSLLTGKIIEQHNDILEEYPVGSLLKLIYAYSLKEPELEYENIALELAESSLDKLKNRSEQLDIESFSSLINSSDISSMYKKNIEVLLGYPDKNSFYPIKFSLKQLAMLLRKILLKKPRLFYYLKDNGKIENSTLFGSDPALLKVLRAMNAMTKTGTITDNSSIAILGYLMIAWPADNPVYLGIIRMPDTNGKGVANKSLELLSRFASEYNGYKDVVRLKLLSNIDKKDIYILPSCKVDRIERSFGKKYLFSECGYFNLYTSANSSKLERIVSGLIEENETSYILELDPYTYAESVLTAEGDNLSLEAKNSLWALIFFNSRTGESRHKDTNSLCDTTHCMVFRGENQKYKDFVDKPYDYSYLEQCIKNISEKSGINWFMFSLGGDVAWQEKISLTEVQQALEVSNIGNIQRENRKNGSSFIHVYSSQGSVVYSCEDFRKKLKLKSCLESADRIENYWIFKGVGRSHSSGLDKSYAERLAMSGVRACDILKDAFLRESE